MFIRSPKVVRYLPDFHGSVRVRYDRHKDVNIAVIVDVDELNIVVLTIGVENLSLNLYQEKRSGTISVLRHDRKLIKCINKINKLIQLIN